MNSFLISKFEPRFQYLIRTHGFNKSMLVTKTGIYKLRLNSFLNKDRLPSHAEFEKILNVFSISEDEFWALKVNDEYRVDSKELGERLRFFRMREGMSRKDLSRKLFITSPQMLPNYESGRTIPTQENLLYLLTAFNIDLHAFWTTDIGKNIDASKNTKKEKLFELEDSKGGTDSRFIDQYLKYKKYEGLSSSAIACLLDVDLQQIIDMENGLIYPNQVFVKEIITIFKVSNEIFYNSDPQIPVKKQRIKKEYSPSFKTEFPLYKDDFPLIIASLRLKLGLNQREFAQHLGISPALISSFELGKNSPNFTTFNTILSALKITKDEFLQTNLDYIKHNSFQCFKKEFPLYEDKFPLIIASLRLKLGLNQREFAQHLGILPAQVSKFELGASLPNSTTFYSILSALKITKDELLQTNLDYIKLNSLGDFGLRIKYFRIQKKLSKQGFANMLGISLYMVNRIENRKEVISVPLFEKLIQALGITENDFLSIDSSLVKKNT